jgi:septal ring factor EnvC (AmiA/AmiB activator)
MTASDLPDFDELAVELVRLRHQQAELARRLEKAEERAAQFPSDFSRRTLDELRADDTGLRARIAELEEQLRPVLRRPEPH